MCFIIEIYVNFNETKKNKIKVCLNNEFFGWFKQSTLIKLKIKNNIALSSRQLCELQKSLENEYCKPKALQLLSMRDHSTQELKCKLEKIANSKTVKKIVEKLQALGFINDYRYAENLAKKLILKKQYGVKRVAFELKLRGISSEIVSSTIENLKINPLEPLLILIKKKYLDKILDFKSKQKIIRILLQKGHNLDNILKAISILTDKQEGVF